MKKNYTFLLLSLATLMLASTIHNSAFAWFPQFLILSLVILKFWKKKLIYYLGLIITLILSLTLFYLPVIIYYLKFPYKMIDNQTVVVTGLSNYFTNLIFNFTQIFQSLSLSPILMVFFGLPYLLIHSPRIKIFILIGLSLFLTPIIFSSFFHKNQIHYLILSFGVFTIVTSGITTHLLKFISKLSFLRRQESNYLWFPAFAWMTVVIILIILKVFTSNFAFLNDEVIKQKSLYPEDKELILTAVSSIQNHIVNIQKTQNSADVNFFQIASFASNPDIFRYPPLDTIFLVPLEKQFKLKLAKISDENIYTIVQTNQARYIFLACFEFYQKHQVKDCSGDFLNLYPNFTVVKNIYLRYPISIFLAKRNE